MKFYHIHRNGSYDFLYHEGQVINAGNDYNNLKTKYMDTDCLYPTAIASRYGEPIEYRTDLERLLNIDKYNEMDRDEQIELLEAARNYIHAMKIVNRENILENVRSRYYKDKPSRQTCMWLTTEDDLNEWVKLLTKNNGKDLSIFEMSLDGNIFMSCNELIPYECDSLKRQQYAAFHYWEPQDKYLRMSVAKEILFEGEAKVLKRVN